MRFQSYPREKHLIYLVSGQVKSNGLYFFRLTKINILLAIVKRLLVMIRIIGFLVEHISYGV